MPSHADKGPGNKSKAVASQPARGKGGGGATSEFVDNRPEANQFARIQEIANNSPRAKKAAQLQAMINQSPRAVAQRQQIDRMFGPAAQRRDAPDEEVQRKAEAAPAQLKENNTGLPDNVKAGVENLSGISLDNVNVHYNSAKPAQLNALAYTQGTDIHVGPGQEQHLPHEAWHVAQQKQGRVKPTMQMAGTQINDDAGLEHEADVMGAKAVQMKKATSISKRNPFRSSNAVAQLAHYRSGGFEYLDDQNHTLGYMDDNFDEVIKPSLHQPTPDGTVNKYVNEGTNRDVILWRSTSGASLSRILAAGSAGGDAAAQNVAAPGREVQKQQIAVGGVAPEYTADSGLTGFSFLHWLVVVRINTKYLARGSGSESGWICSSAAPVVVLDTVDRTKGMKEAAWTGAA